MLIHCVSTANRCRNKIRTTNYARINCVWFFSEKMQNLLVFANQPNIMNDDNRIRNYIKTNNLRWQLQFHQFLAFLENTCYIWSKLSSKLHLFDISNESNLINNSSKKKDDRLCLLINSQSDVCVCFWDGTDETLADGNFCCQIRWIYLFCKDINCELNIEK